VARSYACRAAYRSRRACARSSRAASKACSAAPNQSSAASKRALGLLHCGQGTGERILGRGEPAARVGQLPDCLVVLALIGYAAGVK
jgi:hypothetical protein